MEQRDEDSRRTVIPRWRALNETPQHELGSTPRRASTISRNLSHIMDVTIAQWQKSPTAINAVEVADAVALLGQDPRADAALAFLRSQQQNLVPLVTSRLQQRAPNKRAPYKQDELRKAIVDHKRRLKDQPRNSIGHVEVSRLYAIAGQVTPAMRHMDLALKISPNNRYVLRSAARLFVHDGDPLKGLHYLQKSDAIRVDPWLMAAEVATADLAEKSPRWGTKHLNAISNHGKLSIDYSELASALGALEDEHGSHKLARKLIKRSLDQPTENSLAQALWMSTKAKREFLPLNEAYQDTAYEAGVIQAIHVKEFDRADRFAWNWLNDEPFSSLPAAHGSFVNCVFTRSFERALAFAERGLVSNPDDDLLLNNRTFALIMAGKLDDARKYLPALGMVQPNNSRAIFDLALHGLFNFKSHKVDDGRQFYAEAIKRSLPHYPALYASALAHWLENEVLSGQTTYEEFQKIAMAIDERLSKLKADTTVWAATKDFLTRHFARHDDIRSIKNPKTGELIRFVIR